MKRRNQPDPGTSSSARYGSYRELGKTYAGRVFDRDPVYGYWIAIDADLDGDLDNDRIWPLRRSERDWRAEITAPPRTAGGSPMRFAVAFDSTDVNVWPRCQSHETVSRRRFVGDGQ